MEGDYRDPRPGYNRHSAISCVGLLAILLGLPLLLSAVGLDWSVTAWIVGIAAVALLLWNALGVNKHLCPRCGRPLRFSLPRVPAVAPPICTGCGLEFDQLPH